MMMMMMMVMVVAVMMMIKKKPWDFECIFKDRHRRTMVEYSIVLVLARRILRHMFSSYKTELKEDA